LVHRDLLMVVAAHPAVVASVLSQAGAVIALRVTKQQLELPRLVEAFLRVGCTLWRS
jgi:hypothetical protein